MILVTPTANGGKEYRVAWVPELDRICYNTKNDDARIDNARKYFPKDSKLFTDEEEAYKYVYRGEQNMGFLCSAKRIDINRPFDASLKDCMNTPKLVTSDTYGEPYIDHNGDAIIEDYDELADEIWKESTENVNVSCDAYNDQREACPRRPFEPTGNAVRYHYMLEAFGHGRYPTEALLMLAQIYEDEMSDSQGADLIRQFGREFNRRGVTLHSWNT
jgi:hypothetical protein